MFAGMCVNFGNSWDFFPWNSSDALGNGNRDASQRSGMKMICNFCMKKIH